MTPHSFGCRPYSDKIGVLLAQLGTPAAPTAAAVRPYLREFLGDPRVIETNRLLWWLILNGLVLPRRPKRSARLYKRIWRPDGSPLDVLTQEQTNGVGARLKARYQEIEIIYGMRYGEPSLKSAIDQLVAKGCSRILLFPMYPQYSAVTTGSTYDVVFAHLLKRRWVPTLKVAQPYYRHGLYLRALAATINDGLAAASAGGPVDRLIFSYHGIPERYVKMGDPYCCQCTETTHAVLPLLQIAPQQVIHTYQSRFGREPWLVPYTDETIAKLARDGVRRIAVACPGFTADCLETLDEIGNEAREQFKHLGGEELHLIPCLNDHPVWLDALEELIREELGSWLNDQRADVAVPRCAIQCPVKEEHNLNHEGRTQ